MLHGKQEPNPLHHNLLLPLYVCPAVIIAASQIPEAGDQIGEFSVITVWVFYAASSLAILLPDYLFSKPLIYIIFI